MEELFLEVLNRSIAAGWMIAAVILVRLLLKNAPRRSFCLLWGLVGVRLVCPISLESVFSLIPSARTVPPQVAWEAVPQVDSGVAAVDLAVNRVLAGAAPDPAASVNPLQIWIFAAAVLWAAGMIAMALYGVVSWLRLRKKVAESVLLEGQVWICDQIPSPFLLGIFRPRIYLPSGLGKEEIPYVLAHEHAHLKGRDHWWKPLGFLILAVHWFNPLCWLAYGMFCRDLELACDQRVVRDWDLPRRKAYSQALLACSAPRSFLGAAPLAFGETGVQGRIRAVLENRKAGAVLIGAAAVACLVVALCFLTNPKEESTPSTQPDPAGASSQSEAYSAGEEPADSVIPLTQESADRFIQDTLSSLVMGSDGTLSFTVPQDIPVDEEGKTQPAITLSASFSPEPGTFSVQTLLDVETGWTRGQTYRGRLEEDRGELVQVTFAVFFITQEGPDTWRQYAANYLELTPPFAYDTAPTVEKASAAVRISGEETILDYRFQNAQGASVSLKLPDGWTVQAAPEEGEARYDAQPPAAVLLRDGQQAGTLCLYPFAVPTLAELEGVDPASSQLPMQIFATTSLGNHQGYEDYQVRKSWDTGAAATAIWWWQDLSQGGTAVNIPRQDQGCVLAYDWAVMPYYTEILLEPGTLTEEQLADLAGSMVIAPVQP